MPDWFILLLAILGCYRIAMLLTQDDIFKPIQNYFGLHPKAWVRNSLGELFHCPYCMGVWIALFISLGVYGVTWQALIMWMVVAGGQAFMQSLGNRE